MTVPVINQGSFPLASATNGDPFSCIAGGNLAQSSQIMSYNPASVAITGGTSTGVAMNGGTLNGVAVGSVAGYVPPSSPWLSDSVHGVDIYGKGFVQRPTIFFDPTATTSRNLGTYKNPYTTVAQVQARVAGNMAGQVLGLKRGMTLRSGLAFTCYGSSSAPFYIVPYGDAQALPIINGGTVRTGWSVYGGDARFWQNAATFATAVDAFEVLGGVYSRLWGVSSIANLQAYISAPVAGTVGAFTRVANTLYIYLRDGSNPNGGQIETADAANALKISYTDTSGTGNIIVAGIAARMSRDSALSIAPANASGTNAPSNIQVVGCQGSQAGAQFDATIGSDGIIVYGINDTVRLTGGYLAGNYCYENLNNGQEVGAWSGGTVERNIGYANGGNGVVEMWALTSSMTVRWNRSYGDPNIRTANRPGRNDPHDGGIWIGGYSTIAGGTVDPTKNTGNSLYGNYIQDFGGFGIDLSGDQGTAVFNNTLCTKNATIGVGVRLGGGATATGRNIYNNLQFRNAGETFCYFVRKYNTAADLNTPVPTLNYNVYVNKSTPGAAGGAFRNDATEYFSLATWRTFTSQEANSTCSLDGVITDGWTWGPLLNGDGVAWLAGNTDYSLAGSGFQAAGASIASTSMLADVDGRAIAAPSTPNVGANQG